MFGLGTQELMVILLLALLLFGAQKLPELARGLGKSVKEFRKATEADADEEGASKPAAPSGAAATVARTCASCNTPLDAEWAHCPRCGASARPAATTTAQT
ncbi:MAG: twin-arginine translocase TatA/TatE family subunit [Candidatus Rokubacteria bacterium]|nr:twin-arginine translocase TatA/TatE family subunit [Candidatus Rokubacteria bacterium]